MKVKEENEKVGLKLNIQKTKMMTSGRITSWRIDEKTVKTVADFIFWGSKITADGDCSHEIKRHLFIRRKAMTNLDSILKSRDITLLTKVCLWMCLISLKEIWALKNWCFWAVMLEKTLESPLDCKEIKLVNPKRNQSWIFIGRTDAEAEAPILWPPDVKTWLIGIDPDAGKDWRQEEKGMTEGEMVQWHHQLGRYEFEHALGAGDGQGTLECYRPWGCKVRHDWVTELNWALPGDEIYVLSLLGIH